MQHREVNVRQSDYGFDALSATRISFDHNILPSNDRRDKRRLRVSGICDAWKCRLETSTDSPGEAQTSER
jgi:hypothetical protein